MLEVGPVQLVNLVPERNVDERALPDVVLTGEMVPAQLAVAQAGGDPAAVRVGRLTFDVLVPVGARVRGEGRTAEKALALGRLLPVPFGYLLAGPLPTCSDCARPWRRARQCWFIPPICTARATAPTFSSRRCPHRATTPHLASSGSVKLVIEVKGSWNVGVPTAQAEQLAGRYLPEAGTDVGIDLVGWYPIEL